MRSEETNETAAAPRPAALIRRDEKGLVLSSLEDSLRFSRYVVASGLAPKGDTPEGVLVKIQAGAELGLSPLRSLTALVVVNGRLSMMGEAALALCRRSGAFDYISVRNEGDREDRAGVVQFKRKGEDTNRVQFTLADAKKARLVGKGGPWDLYTDDMLIWKAVSRFTKRYASDLLYGIEVVETAPDIPAGTRGAAPALEARIADPSVPAPEEPDALFEVLDAAESSAEEPTTQAPPSEEEYKALLAEEESRDAER